LLLTRTLESLFDQRAGSVRYEVVVVDNNSCDGTRTVVETFMRRSPHLRYLFEPRPGVSHARNTGIAAACAPVVAFIDDDVEASQNWVAAIKHVFDAHPEIDCIGGRIDPRWSAPPPTWLTPMFWGAVALQADKADTPYVDADHAVPCLMTANFACRRAALDQVGGFSPDYMRDEDRELQLRLWSAAKRGLYVGDIAVTTEVPPDRMTKHYHRQFYARNGESHSRMRYLDRIDVSGRLLPEIPRRATLFGTPGFIYRSLLLHAAWLAWSTATTQRDRAFFHETRLRYFFNYVRTRYRQGAYSLRAIPRELRRFVIAVAASRTRALAGRSGGVAGRSLNT
jgi:glycosyltransferase involved in cell wall biosynthesis